MVAAALFRKTPVVVASRIPTISSTVKRAAPMKSPPSGWRTPTIKDRAIIEAIVATPALTAREYGDRLGYFTTLVNECVLNTREARAMAEQGMIAIPSRGATPIWARLLNNPAKRRQRIDQFGMVRFSNKINGNNRSSLKTIAQLVSRLSLVSSPSLLKEIRDSINSTLISTGKARAAEQALLQSSSVSSSRR